jgi:hypothetical protein
MLQKKYMWPIVRHQIIEDRDNIVIFTQILIKYFLKFGDKKDWSYFSYLEVIMKVIKVNYPIQI